HNASRRPPRPRAEPHELLALAVLLDRHAQPQRTGVPAPHFEVPVVERAAAQHGHTLRAQLRLERAQPRVRRAPPLAPEREAAPRRPHNRAAGWSTNSSAVTT